MAETAVLSGPSHAEEVSRGLPTLCVAGSRKKNVRGVRPVHLHQPGVPRIHEPGCPGDRDRRRVKERCCPGGRESLTVWVTGTTRKQPSSPAVWRRSRDLASPWAENTRPIHRTLRDRRPDRDMRQHAQQKPPRRYPHRKRIHDGRSNEGSPDGGRRRLLSEGCEIPRKEIQCFHADR